MPTTCCGCFCSAVVELVSRELQTPADHSGACLNPSEALLGLQNTALILQCVSEASGAYSCHLLALLIPLCPSTLALTGTSLCLSLCWGIPSSSSLRSFI